MKKQEMKFIGILILIGVITIAIIYFCTKPKKEENNIEKPVTQNEKVEEYVQVLEDGTKYNTSTKLKEPKIVEGLEISNIQLTYKNGQSVVLADVVNTKNEKSKLIAVELILLDKDGNEIEKTQGLIEPLNAGAKTQLNMGLSKDCANAYNFTIVKK